MSTLTTIHNYYGGAFYPPLSDEYILSENPAHGKPHLRLPNSRAEEVDAAVSAAEAALPAWSALPPSERAAFLNRAADLLEERLDAFALAESQDQGKTLALARSLDISRSVYNLRFFAKQCVLLHATNDSHYPPCISGSRTSRVLRKPVGVCGLISPWNLPLYLLTWKIAPCIAYGNVCVCKPSEFTSLTASLFCQVLEDAHFPPGVVNMVFGLGPTAGQAIVSHPRIPLISFTGGTATGEHISRAAAPFFKKLSLELGGKNPAIILRSADIPDAVATTLRSSFLNQGEICLCTSRILVHSSIYQEVLDALVLGAASWHVGPPSDPSSNAGAIVSKAHLDKIHGMVRHALEENPEAILHCGGAPIDVHGCEGGYFFPPTILSGVKRTDRIWQEEVFGPVITLHSFDSDAEAIAMANDTVYGLAATVHSADPEEVHRVAPHINAGTVWVNCWMVRELDLPFGGFKHSGIGREGAKDSYDFFTETSVICSPF